MEHDPPEQTSIPTLHHLSSSQSIKVLWALEELQAADNTFKYVLKNYPRVKNQAPPELKEIFPLGKSPILTVELPDQSGSKETITEGRLILQYVADHYSQGIWDPSSAEDRKQDAFYQEFANGTLAAKVSFALIFEAIPPQLPFPFRQFVSLLVKPVVNHWKQDLKGVYQIMEDALSEERPWFSGAKIGLADFNAIWGVDVAMARGYLDTGEYPKIARWHMTVHERPAFKSAMEKGGSYDLVNWT